MEIEDVTLRFVRHLLWIESGTGRTAGVTVLALSAWASNVHAMSRTFILAMGAANLASGAYP